MLLMSHFDKTVRNIILLLTELEVSAGIYYLRPFPYGPTERRSMPVVWKVGAPAQFFPKYGT